MDDQLKRVVRASLFIFSGALFIWILAPDYRSYAAGFMLGMMISIINGWILMTKIEQLGRNIVERAEKRVQLGFVSRICMSIIAVMIAVKLPQVDLVLTIIGLFYVQMATLLIGLLVRRD
jgi:ATP synthase protein I